MKNNMLNIEEPESNEDKDKAIHATIGPKFQSVYKGFLNLGGRIIGNGNGAIHVTFQNNRNYYGNNHNPLVPSDEQSREESTGAKLLKHDQPDSANINGSLLTKSSPPTPSSSSLSRRCNKRAVLCGITYGRISNKYRFRLRDILAMKNLLVMDFAFPNDCIRVLTDEEESLNLIPTKRNIMESLKWLVKDCEPGDSLVFYFTGTVLKVVAEEASYGRHVFFREGLCPTDGMSQGVISEDEIRSTIVWPLKKDVTLHLIIDAAHGGNLLGLKYQYDQKDGIWNEIETGLSFIEQNTNGGLVICLGAFNDDRIPVEFRGLFRNPKRTEGVLTFALLNSIGGSPGNITYDRLLFRMHTIIKDIYCYDAWLRDIFQLNVVQDPILSSSKKFDAFTRIFKM